MKPERCSKKTKMWVGPVGDCKEESNSCGICSFLCYPIVERTEQHKLEGQNAEQEGARGTTSLAYQPLENRAQPGFSLHFLQVSVQLVSGSASWEDCVSQVTYINPVRIFRVGLVPHTLCLLSVTPTGGAQSCVWFFQFISYSEPPSINPFRGKRIGLRQRFPS